MEYTRRSRYVHFAYFSNFLSYFVLNIKLYPAIKIEMHLKVKICVWNIQATKGMYKGNASQSDRHSVWNIQSTQGMYILLIFLILIHTSYFILNVKLYPAINIEMHLKIIKTHVWNIQATQGMYTLCLFF